MDLKEAFKLALQSLWANKLRTVLTLLGVMIGVASVIAVVTLVNGANAYVDQKLNTFGSDVFTVSKQPTAITSFEDYTKFQKRKNIQVDAYRWLVEQCQKCALIGVQQTTRGTVKFSTESVTDVTLRGWTSGMPVLNNLDIAQGRTFTQSEEDHSAHVALIGTDIQENLLKSEDPIGKEIRVDGVSYTVVGVGAKQGKTLGQSQDNWIAVPLPAFQRSYGMQKSVTIFLKAKGGSGLAMQDAMEEVRVLMRAFRHDIPGSDDDFNLDQNDAFATIMKQITGWFAAIAIPAAGISLVVGGIVIMNIMLVSVTERTREIGIRKAVGARKKDVMAQFIIESALMSLVGGVIGVIGGVIVAYGVTIVAGFPANVAVWSILVGLFVSTVTGVFFGVYPARKAADLDPIVALRSDV